MYSVIIERCFCQGRVKNLTRYDCYYILKHALVPRYVVKYHPSKSAKYIKRFWFALCIQFVTLVVFMAQLFVFILVWEYMQAAMYTYLLTIWHRYFLQSIAMYIWAESFLKSLLYFSKKTFLFKKRLLDYTCRLMWKQRLVKNNLPQWEICLDDI